MNLLAIVVATLAAGIGSVWIAATLMRLGIDRGGDGQRAQYLLSLAAGALLATAFMHLLPEAFESGVAPATLFGMLLFGLVFFFLLDKAELWHHGHEHHHLPGLADPQRPRPSPDSSRGTSHDHHAGNRHAAQRTGGWAVLTGDSVHCFGDGILIASAFMADLQLGAVAALAVLVHEVPHHIGDLVVLRQTSPDARVALFKVSLAGTVTVLGGVVGWWLVDQLNSLLPYFLVLAASSFVYVALADLIPQLQRKLDARQTGFQIAWLAVGIALVTLVSGWGDHGHEGGHGHDHVSRAAGVSAPPQASVPVAPRAPGQ